MSSASRPLSFDPRTVPVVGVDSHLPVLDRERLNAAFITSRFNDPPVWEPEIRVEARFSDRPYSHAAVLVPLVMRDELQILLTKRASHLNSHSGQVAFPGGKADPEDADLIDTALRETEEETGLQRKHVSVLGTLPIYTTGSGFWVTPVVALVSPDMELSPNHNEVSDVFEVPMSFLMNPANHQKHELEWQGQKRSWYSMPYKDTVEERFIWGATAGMLRNLYRFLRS